MIRIRHSVLLALALLSSSLASAEIVSVDSAPKPETKETNILRRYRLGPDVGYVLGSNTTRVRKEGTLGATFMIPQSSSGLDYGLVYQYGWNHNQNYALLGATLTYYVWDKIPGAYIGGDVGLTDSTASNAFSFVGECFISLKFGYEQQIAKETSAGLEFRKSFRDTNPIVPIHDTEVYFNALIAYLRLGVF